MKDSRSGICADRSNLFCLFIEIFKFLILATIITIIIVFMSGIYEGNNIDTGLNKLRNVFGK
jgi:hypothetical protein